MNNYETMEALKLAAEYYDKETLLHALRVAEYAMQDSQLSDSEKPELFIIAILHDIFKDTNVPKEIVRRLVNYDTFQSILLLTHNNEEQTYDEYMNNILTRDDYLAYVVKKADYKDHFSRFETLTPMLMAKYARYVSEFM